MNAKQLFDAGDLAGALNATTQLVKSQPGNAAPRTFLFELLSFSGDFDRAEKQLDVIGHQDTQSEWGVQVYRNILHAERTRRRVFNDGLKPEFWLDPPQYVQLHLESLGRLRDGKDSEAAELLEKSEDARPLINARRGDESLGEFRDCDDVLAPVLEFIMLSDYVWIPLEQVREIDVSAPERPRDLIWAPVKLTLSDNSMRRGYVPTLYPDTHQHADDAVRLGRMTDWQETNGLVRGSGLRTFLTGDDALSVLELRELKLEVAP